MLLASIVFIYLACRYKERSPADEGEVTARTRKRSVKEAVAVTVM